MNYMIMISFGFFLMLFVGVGILSTLKQKATTEDYLLAAMSLHGWWHSPPSPPGTAASCSSA